MLGVIFGFWILATVIETTAATLVTAGIKNLWIAEV